MHSTKCFHRQLQQNEAIWSPKLWVSVDYRNTKGMLGSTRQATDETMVSGDAHATTASVFLGLQNLVQTHWVNLFMINWKCISLYFMIKYLIIYNEFLWIVRFGNCSVSFGPNITSEKLDSACSNPGMQSRWLGSACEGSGTQSSSSASIPSIHRHTALLMQDREAFSPAVQGILHHTLSDVALCAL